MSSLIPVPPSFATDGTQQGHTPFEYELTVPTFWGPFSCGRCSHDNVLVYHLYGDCPFQRPEPCRTCGCPGGH